MNRSSIFTALSAALAVTAFAPLASADEEQPTTTTSEKKEQVLIGSKVHHGVYAAPEVKLTTFTSDAAMLVGGQVGWVIDKHLVIGLAGYGLTTSHTPSTELRLAHPGTTRTGFGYGGPRFAYIFLPERLVHFSVGVLVGAGGVSAITRERVFSSEDNEWDTRWDAHHSAAFFACEPQGDVEINIHKNVRLAFSGSYRIVTSTDQAGYKSSDLSGPAAGMAFRFGLF